MRYRGILAAGFCTLALAMATGGIREPERPLYGGTILRITDSQAFTAAAASAGTVLEREVASLEGARLLEVDSAGVFQPGIVEAWSYSNDRLELTLLLRNWVRDASGRVLTPYEIMTGFEELVRSNPRSAAARLLLDVRGTDDFVAGRSDRITGISVEATGTLVVSLARPQPLLLHALADINLAPDERLTGHTGWGAFLRAEARLFEPDLSFYRGRPYIDSLCYGRSAPTGGQHRRPELMRVSELRRNVEPQAVEIVFPGRRCVYLAINRRGSAGPLRLLSARAAVLAAIDRTSLVNIFLRESAQVLEHLVPPSALPAGTFEPGTRLEGGVKPVGRLLIGFLPESQESKLVAERVKVDLLVAGIGSDVIPCSPESARQCDLIIVDKLVPDCAPAYAVWGLLCELAAIEGDEIWLRRPWGDEAAWLVELETSLRAEALLLPLYHTAHSVWADALLRDLRFRTDGTLDFENAWIARGPAGDAEVDR
jgi:MarR-like DNA-binding transcriptional regulator SgrR of sgrS sRNA